MKRLLSIIITILVVLAIIFTSSSYESSSDHISYVKERTNAAQNGKVFSDTNPFYTPNEVRQLSSFGIDVSVSQGECPYFGGFIKNKSTGLFLAYARVLEDGLYFVNNNGILCKIETEIFLGNNFCYKDIVYLQEYKSPASSIHFDGKQQGQILSSYCDYGVSFLDHSLKLYSFGELINEVVIPEFEQYELFNKETICFYNESITTYVVIDFDKEIGRNEIYVFYSVDGYIDELPIDVIDRGIIIDGKCVLLETDEPGQYKKIGSLR